MAWPGPSQSNTSPAPLRLQCGQAARCQVSPPGPAPPAHLGSAGPGGGKGGETPCFLRSPCCFRLPRRFVVQPPGGTHHHSRMPSRGSRFQKASSSRDPAAVCPSAELPPASQGCRASRQSSLPTRGHSLPAESHSTHRVSRVPQEPHRGAPAFVPAVSSAVADVSAVLPYTLPTLQDNCHSPVA